MINIPYHGHYRHEDQGYPNVCDDGVDQEYILRDGVWHRMPRLVWQELMIRAWPDGYWIERGARRWVTGYRNVERRYRWPHDAEYLRAWGMSYDSNGVEGYSVLKGITMDGRVLAFDDVTPA